MIYLLIMFSSLNPGIVEKDWYSEEVSAKDTFDEDFSAKETFIEDF